MSLPAIFVEVSARIDGFEKAMGDVSKRLNAVDREAQKAFSGFDKIGSRLMDLGKVMSAAISLPIAGAGIAVTKFASDFDAEMRKVTSLLGGSTKQEFDALNRQVLQVSRSLGVDATESAKALYEVISAGIPKDNAIDFLAQASKTAVAGTTQTAVAVDSLTTIIAAYGLETKQAKAVSDAMFQAVNVGKFTFEQLAAVIGPAAAQAHSLGISYQELLAATGTLSITSGSVGVAVTQIESAMRALLDPTKQMKAALSGLGFASGEAATKTLGLEGTLEALRKQSGNNTAAFNALFGRIEGFNAGLGLTGERAKAAAADYKTLQQSSEGLGATQRALDEINKGIGRQFQILSNDVKATAIEMGTALFPAVKNLVAASKPLTDALAASVRWFAELPPGVQSAAIAIAAMAVATGPLILAMGSIIKAVAVVGPAITSLTGALGVAGGVGLTGTLAFAAPIAIAFGVAIAGWAIAHAISEIGKLDTEILRLQETLSKGNKANQEQADTIKALEGVLTAHNKQIGTQRVEVDATGKSVTEYIDALKKAIKENNVAMFAIEQTTAAVKKTGVATGAAADSADALKEAVKRTEAAYKNALRAYDDGKISLEQLGKAQENFIRAQDAADPERAAKRHEAAYFSMLDRYDHMAKEIIKLSADVKQADKDVAESALKNAIDFAKAHEQMANKVEDQIKILIPLYELIPAAFRGASAETKKLVADLADSYSTLSEVFGKTSAEAIEALVKLRDAERDLTKEAQKFHDDHAKSVQNLARSYDIIGIKSIPQLQELARATEIAARNIAKAEGVGSVNVLAAQVKAQEARIDLARHTGEEISDAERHELEARQQQLDIALGKQTKSQKDWARRVIQIVNDLKNDIARALVDTFKNIFFDSDGFNRQLDEDSQRLREELAERAQAIAEFQATTVGKIASVESGYAKQLERETNDLQAELAERASEYEKYAREVAEQLDTLRNTESARLAEELDKLAETLRNKEGEYEDYVYEVAGREQEIRESHAARLAEQLADLRDNLADRAEAYADFVAEANRNLQRIGQDLDESISDDTRSANRKIEDENRDFAKDTKKLMEDLDKAEKKGDKELTRAIRQELQTREADHQRTIQRIREDLDEQISDARRAAERQTEDLQTQLAIRTRENQQYIAENIADQAAVTEGHRAEQEKQLADLQESLDRRTEQLLAFRATTDLAMTAAAEASKARYAKEEADLNASLGVRRVALDQFKIDTEAKIDALTEYYKLKQDAEVADLRQGFVDKLAEYDTYRTGVEQKLEDLINAHKGPLDRLRDMFVDVFKQAGESLLELASERVMGVLFDQIAKLVGNAIPSIGTALGKVLGQAGSGAGGAAGTAGGAASSGGGGGGGGGGTDGLSAGLSVGQLIVDIASMYDLRAIRIYTGAALDYLVLKFHPIIGIIDLNINQIATAMLNWQMPFYLKAYFDSFNETVSHLAAIKTQGSTLNSLIDIFVTNARVAATDTLAVLRDQLATLEDISASLLPSEYSTMTPTMSAAGAGGGGQTINIYISGKVDRSTIDYAVAQISRNSR